MATNRRDVELGIAVKTAGAEEIQALAARVRELAQQGDAAAPEFKELAAEIDKLAEQAEAVAAVRALGDELGDMRATQELLSASVTEYRTRLDGLKGSLTSAQAEQAKSNATLADARRATQEAADAVTAWRVAHDKSGQQTAEYTAKLKELRLAHLQAKDAQRDAAETADKAAAATKDAKAAYSGFAAEVKSAEAPLKLLNVAIGRQAAEMVQATAAMQKAGIESKELAQAENEIRTALAVVNVALDEQSAALQVSISNKQRLAAIEEKVAQANVRNLALASAAAKKYAQDEQLLAATRLKSAEAAAQSAAAQKASLEKTAAAVSKGIAEMKAQAAAAGAALENAFGKTGVRSAQAIQAEIVEIRQAMARLRNDSSVTGAEMQRAFGSANTKLKELDAELRGVSASSAKLGGAFGGAKQAFQQFAAAYGLFEAGREFIASNTQLENLRRTMTLVTGSSEQANKQIAFLRETANTSGVAIRDVTQSFIRFQTAANLAGIESGLVNDVFRSITNAAGQLGISGDRVGLMLDALAQTASKGVVSMEELRQQLGDSLPGAMGLTAKGLGITEKALIGLVESGQLLTEDFLPGLKAGLATAFGDGTKQVDGFAASWARLKNAVNTVFTFIGDSGVFSAMTVVMQGLSNLLIGVTAGFELLGRSIGITLAALANFDWKNPAESAKAAFAAMGEAKEELRLKVEKATGQMKVAEGEAAKAATDASTQVAQAAKGHDVNATAQAGVAKAATTAAVAQEQAGTAAKAGGEKAQAAGGGWVALTVAYGQALERAEDYTVQTVKLADAKKAEVDATVGLAKLTGDEAFAREAAARGAQDQARALEVIALARQNEVDILRAQVIALEEEGKSLGGLSKAKQEMIQKLNETITAKTAEVEKSTQVANAAKQEAAELRIAAATYADNSEKIGAYRDALDDARTALERQTAALAAGRGTKEQVIAATLKAAEAEAMYRDALADVEVAVKRRIELAAANNTIAKASLTLQLEQARTAEANAQALGQESLALEARIRQKEIEISIVRLAAKEKVNEANAAISMINKLIEEGEATGALTEAKRHELEVRLRNEKAKLIEAKGSDLVIKKLEEEIRLLQVRGSTSRSTSNEYVKDRGREVKALDDVAAAAERAEAAERKRRSVDKEGFSTNTAGERVSMGMPTWLSILNEAKSYGLTDAQARGIAERAAPNGQVTYFGNGLQQDTGQETLSMAIQVAAQKYIRNNATSTPSGSGGNVFGGPAGSTTVNINLGGKVSSIKVASAADATALTNVLRDLEEAAGRGG